MKDTKRSFLTSCISLLLCFVMLLGTTFAWFTDVAVSANNVIQAGNLDIELQWSKDGTIWHDVGGLNDKPIFTHDAWEPGYTEVRYIKVKNEGSLAFKYQMLINPNGLVGKLAEVIDVSYDVVTDNSSFVAPTASDKQGSLKKVASLNDLINANGTVVGGVLLPDGVNKPDYFTKEIVVCVSLHMDEFAGNEYQNLSIGGTFGIKLVATQFDYENDSFDNSYDNGATWPDTIVGNSASSSVTLNSDNTLTDQVTMTSPDGMISATLPAGTKMEQGTTSATLSVSDLKDSGANITLSGDEESRSIDVHVNGVAEDNTSVMTITVKELLPTGLNMGNHRFYHVEDGNTMEMTLLQDGQTPVHNNYEYDPATGDVTLYLKSFSEVAVVAEPAKWEGNRDYSWYTNAVAPVDGESVTEYTIANADQLAAFGAIVGGMAEGIERDSFSGKTVKLLADINLGDKESENNPDLIFYPIGYNSDDGKYEKTDVAINSSLKTFEGTFDGNGHTISNFYHNTWEMKGDHNWYDATLQYYRDGMGLFGRVYKGTVKNLTVKNFSSDGEIATTGVIAAYADGATFENIAIFNCNPRVYNIGNGGIVGCVGWYAKEANLKTTFKNITVDNSNKISALWGSYDVPCGGIVGQYYPTSGQTSAGTPVNGGISFENCHVSAQLDVYNDVCANYQYYAYRYAGMLIGSVRENVTIDGHSYPKMDGITATGCTVHFGTWNDYYYCEFEKNGHPSYSGPDDYKFSRIPHSEINFTDSNGNGIIDTEDERASVTGCKHEHTAAEDNQCVYLEFNNLVTGYGWGVTTMSLTNMPGVENLDVTHTEQEKSVEKFENNLEKNELVDCNTYKLGDIFNFVDKGVELKPQALNVSITNLAENNPVSATVVYDTANWENGTITFTGVGTIIITIQDYYFCTPTTITVTITSHVHVYDNDCDATCNICDEIREIGDHVYDNDCDMNCNECGATRTVGDHIYDNACDTTCNECGATRETNHIPGNVATCTEAQKCTVCGVILEEALGHTEVIDKAVDATCTTTGLTEGKHCSVCNEVIVAQTVVDKLAHKPSASATCTTAQTCTVCNVVLVAALGHDWKDATCTNPKICQRAGCGATDGEALGHIETKFTGDFLYRVGNENAVQLSSLFNVGKHNVTVIGSNVAGNASVTVNGTTLEFNGTGVVKVIITNDCTCDKCELELNLEVVDAYNATGAMSATDDTTVSNRVSNNVVLLNDIDASSIKISDGYTFCGNGFKVTFSGKGDYRNAAVSYGFVTIENGGVLDNTQIICNVFPESYLYASEMKAGSDGRYPYGYSAVIISGNSTISNSYIYGARNNIHVTSGNVTIDNTVTECGSLSNIHIKSGSEYTVTLRDVTTIQYITKSNYDTSKNVMGFGVLVGDNDSTSHATIKLEGDLKQYNWVNKSHYSGNNAISNSHAKTAIELALNETKYQHTIDGQTTVNLGIVFQKDLDAKVIDNRNNKNSIPYALSTITMLGYTGKVYSISSGSGITSASRYDAETDGVLPYKPTTNGIITPSISHGDNNGSSLTISNSYNDGWVTTFKADLDNIAGGSYTFKFSDLTVTKNGIPLQFTVKDSSGNAVSNDTGITLNQLATMNYTLTVTDNQIYNANGELTGDSFTHEMPFVLYATKTSIAPPKFTGIGSGVSGSIRLASSSGGNWRPAYPALEGVYVEYWSASEGKMKTIDLSTLTSKGTISGQTWTYTCDDFTLTITGGPVHTTTSYVLSPKVATRDGSDVLYFAAMNKDNSTGTTARLICLEYVFTDKNASTTVGQCQTYSNGIATVQYANLPEFSWSSFQNGKVEAISSGGGGCVTPDTLITLADGSQVRVDSLTGNEELFVWNLETGKLDKAPIMFVDSDPEAEVNVVKLYFSDGTEVKVIYEHGFWDYDLNKYVYLDENAADYIGHTFAKQNGDSLEKVTLVDVVIETELTTAWSPVTVGHLCYFVNGMLSMPGGVGGLFNIFEVDPETMTYDFEAIERDIETYGLFTYEELNAICPLTEEMFNAAGGAYLKISIGKGNLTIDELINMINRYSKYI